jgi:hypothetical protein
MLLYARHLHDVEEPETWYVFSGNLQQNSDKTKRQLYKGKAHRKKKRMM